MRSETTSPITPLTAWSRERPPLPGALLQRRRARIAPGSGIHLEQKRASLLDEDLDADCSRSSHRGTVAAWSVFREAFEELFGGIELARVGFDVRGDERL